MSNHEFVPNPKSDFMTPTLMSNPESVPNYDTFQTQNPVLVPIYGLFQFENVYSQGKTFLILHKFKTPT